MGLDALEELGSVSKRSIGILPVSDNPGISGWKPKLLLCRGKQPLDQVES